VVGLHECQAVPVEHEPDIDEEHPVAGAAVEEFFFKEFPDTPLIAAVADAVILGDILIEFDFIDAGIGTHFVVNKFKDLDARFGQACRLLDAVQEQFDEACGIDFLFKPEAQAADRAAFEEFE